jgi:hypothetical protein
MRECVVVGVHHHLGQQRRDLPSGQLVSESLLQQVADHPLGLRAQYIQRVGSHIGVGLGLQREQSNLRTVAVRDHDPVSLCQLRQSGDPACHVASLGRGVGGLATVQERVTSKCCRDEHATQLPPAWPTHRMV